MSIGLHVHRPLINLQGIVPVYLIDTKVMVRADAEATFTALLGATIGLRVAQVGAARGVLLSAPDDEEREECRKDNMDSDEGRAGV